MEESPGNAERGGRREVGGVDSALVRCEGGWKCETVGVGLGLARGGREA